MAEATLFRVTDEERRMAIELSDEKYRIYVEDERSAARREGLAEGSHQKAIETAKIMKNMNYPLEDIFIITGLSKEEVKNL